MSSFEECVMQCSVLGNCNLTEYILKIGMSVWKFTCLLFGYFYLCVKGLADWINISWWKNSLKIRIQNKVKITKILTFKAITSIFHDYQWISNDLIPRKHVLHNISVPLNFRVHCWVQGWVHSVLLIRKCDMCHSLIREERPSTVCSWI